MAIALNHPYRDEIEAAIGAIRESILDDREARDRARDALARAVFDAERDFWQEQIDYYNRMLRYQTYDLEDLGGKLP